MTKNMPMNIKKMGHELYRHYDIEGRLLYVGISLSSLRRLEGHRGTSAWYRNIATVKIERFSTFEEARYAELQAINEEKPEWNKADLYSAALHFSQIEYEEKSIIEIVRKEISNSPKQKPVPQPAKNTDATLTIDQLCAMSDDNIILSVRQTCKRLGFSRTTLHIEEKREPRNPHFPKKMILSAGRVGYRLFDVERYLLIQQSPDAWHHRRKVSR